MTKNIFFKRPKNSEKEKKNKKVRKSEKICFNLFFLKEESCLNIYFFKKLENFIEKQKNRKVVIKKS